jgi:hypothetical protein
MAYVHCLERQPFHRLFVRMLHFGVWRTIFTIENLEGGEGLWFKWSFLTLVTPNIRLVIN